VRIEIGPSSAPGGGGRRGPGARLR